jgi:hypothetical protein
MSAGSSRQETLLAWHQELVAQIAQLREQQAALLEETRRKEVQLRNIGLLLESEGCLVPEQSLRRFGRDGSLSDCAFALLKETGKPWHYRQLAEKLREVGVHIPGNDRAANLLAHIGRDGRFQRVRRGTYALAEWKPRAMSRPRTGSGWERGSQESANSEGGINIAISKT